MIRGSNTNFYLAEVGDGGGKNFLLNPPTMVTLRHLTVKARVRVEERKFAVSEKNITGCILYVGYL